MEFRNELSRRALLRWGAVGCGVVALGPLAIACSSSSPSKASPATTAATIAADPLEGLLGDAQAEGALNLIAVPDAPGAYYGPVVEGFSEFSGIEPDLAIPFAGSEMELDEVRKQKGEPEQPDVIDVGVNHAITATDEGLLAAFTPEGWSEIPSTTKDPDGHWVATYYGLIGIISNPDLLDGAEPPATLEDLLALPDGVMGFPGDPRSAEAAGDRSVFSSAEGLAAVWTLALARGGSLDDIGPGIDFCVELVEAGVLDPANLGIPERMASGSVAVSLLNNFSFPGSDRTLREEHGGQGLVMNFIPSAPLFPNYLVQAVVADSPHPSAARLWLSYLVSNEGAKQFLEGGAIPIRFPALLEDGEVSADDLGVLGTGGVTPEQLAAIEFPLSSQLVQAQEEVDRRWGPDVMGE